MVLTDYLTQSSCAIYCLYGGRPDVADSILSLRFEAEGREPAGSLNLVLVLAVHSRLVGFSLRAALLGASGWNSCLQEPLSMG